MYLLFLGFMPFRENCSQQSISCGNIVPKLNCHEVTPGLAAVAYLLRIHVNLCVRSCCIPRFLFVAHRLYFLSHPMKYILLAQQQYRLETVVCGSGNYISQHLSLSQLVFNYYTTTSHKLSAGQEEQLNLVSYSIVSVLHESIGSILKSWLCPCLHPGLYLRSSYVEVDSLCRHILLLTDIAEA